MSIATDYINRKFQVNQKLKENKLCIGTITSYIGNKDNMDYFVAEITVAFSGKPKAPVKREIAFKDNDVYLQGANGNRMRCFTELFEWMV